MGQRLPDAMNPLLLGQNLRERLDAGALDLPAFEAAMAEVKQMVRLGSTYPLPCDTRAQACGLESPPAASAPTLMHGHRASSAMFHGCYAQILAGAGSMSQGFSSAQLSGLHCHCQGHMI